jgi:hypothetical protein
VPDAPLREVQVTVQWGGHRLSAHQWLPHDQAVAFAGSDLAVVDAFVRDVLPMPATAPLELVAVILYDPDAPEPTAVAVRAADGTVCLLTPEPTP